jgi:hypothetical protein
MWLLERKGSASDTAPRTAELRLQLQQAERRNQELMQRLDDRSRELADANRRQLLQDHEIDKNVSRVRAVEKRYLEALMRQASANAYLGYRSLRKAEIRLALPGRKPTDPAHLQLVEEADQMVRDYWHWAVEIATSTTPELFPEVKRELAGWLQAREQPDSPGLQRKALDLLERHVGDVRAGHYHRPEDLVAEFTQQPELGK